MRVTNILTAGSRFARSPCFDDNPQMCGIAATTSVGERFVEFALAQMYDRGPDGTSVSVLPFCEVGVNRLAISGVRDGPQPFVSPDGSIVAVLNGAIYNAQSLAEEMSLETKSSNDGEVLPGLYRRYGERFVEYLEGMYAIVIADLDSGRLVVAVDSLGIKPMYYSFAAGKAYFASVPLAFPADYREGLYRMPPGSVWSSDLGFQRPGRRSWRDGDLADLIVESVRQQIPEEVPWGCMLSGGVDSSLIAAVASEISGPIRTFTCGTETSPDLHAAQLVSEIVGSEHTEVVVGTSDVAELVHEVVRCTTSFEPWTVTAGVSTYLTARMASDAGIKVLLSGEGADELFAGYDEFQAIDPAFLKATLHQYQMDLGATECLRLDRATMANSVEARVPYLSTSIIRFSRLMRAGDLSTLDPTSTRKATLRSVAEHWLPVEIAYRAKEEFAVGSGVSGLIREMASASYSDTQVRSLAQKFPAFSVESPVAAWFLEIWLDLFARDFGVSPRNLARRGLLRQEVSDYLAGSFDPFDYLPT